MGLKTIVVIYGTRPEAIKLAPLVVELKKNSKFRTFLMCTGQHKEMLEGILPLWKIEPDLVCDIHVGERASSSIPAIMIATEQLFRDLKPDLVVVQGDTASAAGAAMQAHALHIPVAHVEAGLRSNDIWNPWPEESNRRLIDGLSSLHFAPTSSSFQNLCREGHESTSSMTGNTIVDALNYVSKILDETPGIKAEIEEMLGFGLDNQYILFTQHRREGFGKGQESVFKSILELAEQGLKIVFPVHLNPSVFTQAHSLFGKKKNISLIPPQQYLHFLELTRSSSLIISDSGGLQEEAPSFGKNILITRLKTERPEIVESGLGHLVGFDHQKILLLANAILNKIEGSDTFANPFGDGMTSGRIVKKIENFFAGEI